ELPAPGASGAAVACKPARETGVLSQFPPEGCETTWQSTPYRLAVELPMRSTAVSHQPSKAEVDALHYPNWFLSASSSNCQISSGVLEPFRNRQNVSSRSWREIFSRARKWSPGRSGGETSMKNNCTRSPSRLLKSTPSLLTATAPNNRSTLGCFVCGTA